MAISKEMIADRIEVLENGCIQVRTKTSIKEDGEEISSRFHRYVVAPGDDYAAEAKRVQAICAVTHTPEVVASYKLTIAEAK